MGFVGNGLSGMVKGALKNSVAHILTQAVQCSVCDARVVFAAVQAESCWLRVLVSRQQPVPHVHSTSHHPTLTNDSILRTADKNLLVGEAIITYGRLPLYPNTKGRLTG